MADPNTARVLGLPGGGTRGFMQNHSMKLFCLHAGIAQNEIWIYFSVMAG